MWQLLFVSLLQATVLVSPHLSSLLPDHLPANHSSSNLFRNPTLMSDLDHTQRLAHYSHLASASASARRGHAALLPTAAAGAAFAAAVAEALTPLVLAWLVGGPWGGVAVECDEEEAGPLVRALAVPVQVLRPSASAEQLAPSVGLLACASDADEAWARPPSSAERLLLVLRRRSNTKSALVLLQHLWHSHRLLHALLLTPPDLIEWDPFAPGDGLCVHPAPAPSFDPAAAFAHRLRDMRGAPLVWGGYESGYTLVKQNGTESFRGRNLQLLLAAAQVMRFTPKVLLPLYVESDAEEFRNRSVDVLLEDYLAYRMDVVINSFVVGRGDPARLSYLVPVLDNMAICTLVPLAKAVPLWMSPFLCFDVAAWLWALAACAAGVAAWRWWMGEGTRLPVGGVVALFVSASEGRALRVRGDPQRLFLATAMIFSVVMANAFQGALVNLITKRAFYPQITTIEQLDRSGLPIISTEDLLKNLYGGELSSTYASLARRLVVRATPPSDVAAAVLVACKREAKWERYYAALYPQHRLLRELSNLWPLTLAFPRASPFARRFGAVAERLVQAGVWEKLDRDFFARWASGADRRPVKDLAPRAFALAAVESAFYALLMGLGASLAVFAGEAAWARHGTHPWLSRLRLLAAPWPHPWPRVWPHGRRTRRTRAYQVASAPNATSNTLNASNDAQSHRASAALVRTPL